MYYASKNKLPPIPLRGTGQTRLQKEVQAHNPGHGLEHSVPVADAAGHENGIHPILRTHYPPLHDLPLLRQPDLLLLQRVHRPGDDLPYEQRGHLHQGECPQVSFPALEERADAHQLWPDPLCVLSILYPGRDHVHLEIYPASLSHRLPGVVQHRRRTDFVRSICFFPGYPIPLVGIYHAADVHVRHFLYH